MKQIWSRLKPYLSWVILGGTLIFLAKTLKDHWQEVAAIRIDGAGWACLAIALGVTLLAHICAGWVWSWILQDFKQPIRGAWVVRVYLKTNIAKYIPGNVWHYYGRISAATNAGASLSAATISVLFEPLLMAASALIVALLGSLQLAAKLGAFVQVLQIAILLAVLLGIHPLVMNPVIRKMSKMKRKATGGTANAATFKIDHYPLLPLLGELVFLLLRGTGFVFTFLALSPITLDQILTDQRVQLGVGFGFSNSGSARGTGVFEATALALLDRTVSPGVLLSIVALYRLISILSEAVGAGLATLDDRWAGTPQKTRSASQKL